MVMVEGVGDEYRSSAWLAKGHRRIGAPISGNHAPHLERWHGIPLDDGKNFGNGLADQLLLCIDKPEKR